MKYFSLWLSDCALDKTDISIPWAPVGAKKVKLSSLILNSVNSNKKHSWKVNLCSKLKRDNYPNDPGIACASHRPNFHSDSSGWEILPPLPSQAGPRLMRGGGAELGEGGRRVQGWRGKSFNNHFLSLWHL